MLENELITQAAETTEPVKQEVPVAPVVTSETLPSTESDKDIDEGDDLPTGEGQLSRKERRRLAFEAAQREKEQPKQRVADSDMFRTPQPAGRASNPTLVQLNKDWIDVFNRDCNQAAHDATKRKLASNGLLSVFRSLDRLNKEDTHEVLEYLCNVISTSQTGAYTRRIVFANLKFLPESSHEVMSRMLQLVIIAASDKDRSKARAHTDPLYAINLYTNGETRSNIDSFFE